MSGPAFARLDSWSPQELSLNGVPMNAQQAITIPCEGFNQLTIHGRVTWVAATSMTFFIEGMPKPKVLLGGTGGIGAPAAAADYDRLQSITWAAGTGTLVPATVSNALTADEDFVYNQPINYWRVRIVFPIAAGAGATDLLTVWMSLGNV